MAKEIELVSDKCAALGIKPSVRVLLVSIGTQTLRYFANGTLQKTYVVSTSKRPPSNVKGSLGTPTGLHLVAEKVGGGTPPGIVFKSRQNTGFHFREFIDPDGSDNLVTTRILWLRGAEPGVNQGNGIDSYERYIYIHGTNHEERLGQPQSGGCVLMHNIEIIELFDQVRTGDLVWIGE